MSVYVCIYTFICMMRKRDFVVAAKFWKMSWKHAAWTQAQSLALLWEFPDCSENYFFLLFYRDNL